MLHSEHIGAIFILYSLFIIFRSVSTIFFIHFLFYFLKNPWHLFLFITLFIFIWDSPYSHSLRSFSSAVKLLVTTGFISTWGEVARIIVLMLLLGEEEGGAFCSNVGGLLVCVVLLGNGLAPMLLFQMFGVDVYRVFFFLFFFSLFTVFVLLHTEFFVL